MGVKPYHAASLELTPHDAIFSRPLDLVSGNESFAEVLARAGLDQDLSPLPSNEKAEGSASPSNKTEPCRPSHNFACSPGLGRAGLAEAVVALVGPPGCGKTTTIMKLALGHGLFVSRPVRILTFDPERVGTGARIQRFAKLLNLPFQEFETLAELSSGIEQRVPGLTLIDTAGYGRSESHSIAALACCLLSHSKVERQLVLRVDRKHADNLDVIRRFSTLQPARLILTALDESLDIARLSDLVEEAQLPLSFFGVGQRVPEDLEPARDHRLAELAAARATDPVLSAA